jgi:hypothetical protein
MIIKGIAALPFAGALVIVLAGCGASDPGPTSPPPAAAASRTATPTVGPTPKSASAASNELLFARAMAASIKAVPTRTVAGSLMLTYIRFEHAYDAAWAAAGQPNAVASVARIAGGFKLCRPATSNIQAGCERFTRFTVNQAGQVTGLSVDGEPVDGRLASGPDASSGGLRISGVLAYRLTGAKAVAVAFKLTDTGYRPENAIPAVLAAFNGASEDTNGRYPLPNFLAPGDVLYAAALFDVTQVAGTFCLQPMGVATQLPCTTLSKIGAHVTLLDRLAAESAHGRPAVMAMAHQQEHHTAAPLLVSGQRSGDQASHATTP